MKIGLAKETKQGERRVALIPEHIKMLKEAGHSLFVEEDAGRAAGFPNEEYIRAGATIVTSEEVYQQPLVVRVKEPPFETLRKGQTLMSYLHIEKGQNPRLREALLENKITAYAFEEIRFPKTNHRVVSLGFEAGVVGMFEGLRHYGKLLEQQGRNNPFKDIKTMQEYPTKRDAYLALRDIDPRDFTANVCIAGWGKVSKGAQEVLAQLSHPPLVLREEDTARTKILGQDHAYIWKHLPNIDIIVNAVLWYPGQTRVLTKEDLEMMKNYSLIVDISCDKEGGVETCQPTTWDNPTYNVTTKNNKKIAHFCVDNLPAAMANESSCVLSKMVYSSILKVANGEELDSGLMTKEGDFVYTNV